MTGKKASVLTQFREKLRTENGERQFWTFYFAPGVIVLQVLRNGSRRESSCPDS